MEIFNTEHTRAHRAIPENVKHIKSDYYFPKMTKIANEVVLNCKICTKGKYDRHPRKQELGETPIPTRVGEIFHIDIFSTDKKLFLICIDKFSKLAVVQPVLSRAIADVTSQRLQDVLKSIKRSATQLRQFSERLLNITEACIQ